MRLIAGVCLLGALVLPGSSAGCTGSIAGSGHVETHDFSLSGFTSVDASAHFQVTITEGNSYAVAVTADDNLFEYLDIGTSGGTLHLGVKPGTSPINATLKADITMPRLDALELSGASNGQVTGFTSTRPLTVALSGESVAAFADAAAGETQLILSGASELSGKLTCSVATMEVSGASSIELEGGATTMTANGSGASTLSLEKFVVDSADIQLSGGCNAHVSVIGDLNTQLSGDSHVVYSGNPNLGTVETSGNSSIRRA